MKEEPIPPPVQAKFCPHCGASNSLSASFCRVCGKSGEEQRASGFLLKPLFVRPMESHVAWILLVGALLWMCVQTFFGLVFALYEMPMAIGIWVFEFIPLYLAYSAVYQLVVYYRKLRLVARPSTRPQSAKSPYPRLKPAPAGAMVPLNATTGCAAGIWTFLAVAAAALAIFGTCFGSSSSPSGASSRSSVSPEIMPLIAVGISVLVFLWLILSSQRDRRP